MSCKYLATGRLECLETYTNTDAKLGEECLNSKCAKGVCIAPYGRGRGFYCYNIIKKGEKDCEKSYAVCTKGSYCKNNTCVEASQRQYEKQKEETRLSEKK